MRHRPTGHERHPRLSMSAADVAGLLHRLAEASVPVWIDGGWGVDALLGEQRREHDDVDLIVSREDTPRTLALLAGRGYDVVAGALPGNIVLHDPAGRQVDLHPVAFNDRGDGIYRMENGEDWAYPSWGFAGRGRISAMEVRCLTAEAQILCHDGYELDEEDREDLCALQRKFGVELPPRVLRQ